MSKYIVGPKVFFRLLLPFVINTLENHPSQAGPSDLGVQTGVELPALRRHLLSDAPTFGLDVRFL